MFVFLLWAPVAAPAASILVTTEPHSVTLALGRTETITVKGLVEEPLAGDDGIFTFDLDLILGDPSVLSTIADSVNRPDVDDAHFSGSDGTLEPWGIDAIAGGYWNMDKGVGTAQTFFTVDVLAEAIGTTTVAVGPDTDIMGADLVLYESSGFTVDYGSGSVVFQVVPEPTALALLVSATLFLLALRVCRSTMLGALARDGS